MFDWENDMTNTVEVPVARLEVWDDLHNERPGWYRLFWVVPGHTTGCPAIGYCSPRRIVPHDSRSHR